MVRRQLPSLKRFNGWSTYGQVPFPHKLLPIGVAEIREATDRRTALDAAEKYLSKRKGVQPQRSSLKAFTRFASCGKKRLQGTVGTSDVAAER